MLGTIVKWFAVIICSVILGWTICITFPNCRLYVLDWHIGMAEILSIIVNVILTCVIAQIVNKSLNNSRVEKDFFIKELDSINSIYSDLEKKCSRDISLSLQNTTYDIGRSRKTVHRIWSRMYYINRTFHKTHNNDIDKILITINNLNSMLTDSKYFSENQGYNPIKIAKNHIYLNNSVRPDIDKTISNIRDLIFKLIVSINKM